MKIHNQNQNIAFQRKLKGQNEIAGYKRTLQKAKEVVGNDGDFIFLMHDSCLPSSKESDIGIGNLASKKSLEFFDTMKTYLGINAVEILPQGPIEPTNGIYCAYSSSSLPLSNHVINPEFLIEGEFGSLITQKELDEVIKANNLDSTTVNYKNVLGDSSSYNDLLKKAYTRFKDRNGFENSKFKTFVKENSDWIEPFIQNKNQYDRDFYYFKQFLADEHLKYAKSEFNKRGIKLIGDCQIGFPKEEVEIFKNAFSQTEKIGWGFDALDYDNILNPNSASYKLLKRKVQLAFKRYDTVRMDASWFYVNPKLYSQDGSYKRKDMGESILKLIEQWAKEVKGDDFDTKSILHEFEASKLDFNIFDDKGNLIKPLVGRTKVFTSSYMDSFWGSNHAYRDIFHWSSDEFVIAPANQDSMPIRELAEAEGSLFKDKQIEALSKILNIPKEALKNPIEFAKAKFAEPVMAKNNMVFYLDVFGKKDHFTVDDYKNPKAYAQRLPRDFEDNYIKSVQEGFGFNIMDSFEKIFKAKGYDTKYPELYSEIIKYKNILLENESYVSKNKKVAPYIIAGLGVLSVSLLLALKLIKKHKAKVNN